MVRSGFMKIFWGFLFILLDIRIQHVDLILPDFVGYLLIMLGLGALASLHLHFEKARPMAAIMILLSFADLVELKPHGGFACVLLLINLCGAIVNLIMAWHICQGIIALAVAAANHVLADKADFRWKLYLAMAIAVWSCVALGHLAPKLAAMLAIPLVVFALVVMCLMMGLMLRASRELAGGQAPFNQPPHGRGFPIEPIDPNWREE